MLALKARQVCEFFVQDIRLPRALRNAVAERIATDDRLLDRRAAASRCKAPWTHDYDYSSVVLESKFRDFSWTV